MDTIDRLKQFLVENNKGIPHLMNEAQEKFGAFIYTQYDNIVILTECNNKALENAIFHRKGWEIMYHPVTGIVGTAIFFSPKENKWFSFYTNNLGSLVDGISDENFEYTLDTAGEIIVKYDRRISEIVLNKIKDNLLIGIIDNVRENAEKQYKRPT